VSYKVKLRVISSSGKREKYSFHLEEGHQFPLGADTEGILHSHDSLVAEQCSVVLVHGKIRLVGNPENPGSGLKLNGKSTQDSELKSGDRLELGSFTIECLEILEEKSDVQLEEPSISIDSHSPESTSFTTATQHVDTSSIGEISASLEPVTGETTAREQPRNEPGTLTMIRQEYDNTRVTLQDVSRPSMAKEYGEAGSRTNMTGFTDVGEKTSATTLIHRSRVREDKLTRQALIAAAVVIAISIPVYFGWFGKKHSETSFPVESATATGEKATDWDKPATVEDVAKGEAPEPVRAPAQNVTASAPVAVAIAEPPRAQIQEREKDLFAAAEMTLAASMGNVGALKSIIDDLGVDVNLFAADGKTALMSAAGEGKTEAIQFLLSKGAQANATDSMGTTALMWAAMKGHFNAVQLLVDAGAIAGIPRANGDTAMHIAHRWGHKRIEAFLKNPKAYRALIAQQKVRDARAREGQRRAAMAKIKATQNIRKPAAVGTRFMPAKPMNRTSPTYDSPAVKKKTAPVRRSGEARPSRDLNLNY